MGEITNIEWTWRRITLPDGQVLIVPGHTFNPWIGCMRVAKECQHCYAEAMAQRWGWKVWGPEANTPRRVTSPANWKQPLKWNRDAVAHGHRQSVFCASLSDVFEEHADVVEARSRLWALIEQTPWLNWLLLTKRPENILRLAPWGQSWPDNVWTGTSAGTQEMAKRNVTALLEVPSVVRFVSCEPQLERVDFTPWLSALQWMICGGESGTKARPFDLDWARDVRDQCLAYNVPYFFKQVGGKYHNSGGRALDGRTWDELPPEIPSFAYDFYIVVSADPADREWARWARHVLLRAGYRVASPLHDEWADPHKLVATSERCLVILSQHFHDQEIDEHQPFLDRETTLPRRSVLPIKISPCAPLRDLAALNLTTEFPGGWAQDVLLDVIRNCRAGQHLEESITSYDAASSMMQVEKEESDGEATNAES